VDCDLDSVFDLTNHSAPAHGEAGWQDHPKVKYLGRQSGPRSTSVGDVVVDESGQAWLCKPMGWGRL
jgi:hypothetical protein